MKIEAGKWYKMRDGEKVLIIGETPNPKAYFKFIGVFPKGEPEALMWYAETGEPLMGDNYHIISLWTEPTKPVELPEKLVPDNNGWDFDACTPSYKINQIIDYLAYQQKQIEGKDNENNI